MPRKTGRTANSIGTSIRETPNHIRGLAGTRVKHALALHEGARAHRIYPRRAGGVLRFYWDRTGQIEYFRSVRHPGIGKTPFLTSSLADTCRRLGFKVVLSGRRSFLSRFL